MGDMNNSDSHGFDARMDINKPLWDLSTFNGRLRYFAWMTDYRTVVLPTRRFEEAKTLVEQYRSGTEPPGTSKEQILYAKKLYESAFHPDSGELQNVIGRMSFQVPGGMILTAGMLQFYRSNVAVIFWQWLNQSFNALVNYTNRNAASEITNKQIAASYFTATSSALVAALGLKAVLATRSSSLLKRFVPFVAVASANMVNIPFSRQSELINGVAVMDQNGNKISESKFAAYKGISQVVLSRITIAAPGMCLMPFVMEHLEKKAWFMRYPRLHMPFQTFMIGAFLTVMVPVGCALFPQKSSIATARMQTFENQKFDSLKKEYGDTLPDVLYFNKGL